MQKHFVLFSSIVASVILAAMLVFTNPTEIGALGVFVFLITLYVLFFGVSTLLVKFFTKLSRQHTSRRTSYYSAIIAFGPLMLLLTHSLGSLSLATAILIFVFILIGCFWISKRI